MKIIDLLNKIANGEEIPQTFIYNNLIFELNESGRYIDNEGDYFAESIRYDLENLNEKVIIGENKGEDKKIEKLEYWVEIPYTKEGEYLKKGLQEQAKFNENIYFKINEIIDYINKKGNNIDNRERER